MILRELFVKLGLDLDAQSFAKGELAAEGVKGVLSAIVEVAKESVHALVELVQGTAEAGKALDETAQSTGLTTKALQQLQDVSGELGVDTESFNVGMFQFARNMREAAKGTQDQAAAFAKLHVKATGANGKLRDTDAVLMDVAEGLSKMPDGAEKTAIAMDLFGRSGARLIPVLNKGKEGLAELRGEQETMSDEQIAAGKELIETEYALGLTWRNLKRDAIAPLLPTITELVKRFQGWVKENKGWIKLKIANAVKVVIRAINGLAVAAHLAGEGFELATKAISAGINLIERGMDMLGPRAKEAAAAFALGWMLAAAPLTTIAAIIAGLLLVYDDLRVYQHGGKSLYGRFKQEIDSWLKPNAKDPWWLAAIKELVAKMEEALGLAHKLGIAGGTKSPRAEAAARANKAGLGDKNAGPGANVAIMDNDFDPWRNYRRAKAHGAGFWSALAASNDDYPDAPTAPKLYPFAPTYQPPAYMPSLPSGSVPPMLARGPVDVHLTQHIHPTPGMSEERVGKIAAEKASEAINDMLENTGAAVGP